MKWISDFFYKKTNLLTALILTLVMVLYASLVLGKFSSCFQDQLPEGVKVLGLSFGYSYDYVISFFNSLE